MFEPPKGDYQPQYLFSFYIKRSAAFIANRKKIVRRQKSAASGINKFKERRKWKAFKYADQFFFFDRMKIEHFNDNLFSQIQHPMNMQLKKKIWIFFLPFSEKEHFYVSFIRYGLRMLRVIRWGVLKSSFVVVLFC